TDETVKITLSFWRRKRADAHAFLSVLHKSETRTVLIVVITDNRRTSDPFDGLVICITHTSHGAREHVATLGRLSFSLSDAGPERLQLELVKLPLGHYQEVVESLQFFPLVRGEQSMPEQTRDFLKGFKVNDAFAVRLPKPNSYYIVGGVRVEEGEPPDTPPDAVLKLVACLSQECWVLIGSMASGFTGTTILTLVSFLAG